MWSLRGQHLLDGLMDLGLLLGTVLGTMLDCKRDSYVTAKGPVIMLMLTVAHKAGDV